nr:DNA alkylation repair protein [Actinomycetota bacterium]
GDGPVELLDLALDRDRVSIGDAVTFELTVAVPPGAAPVDAVIDYRVHYVGARGSPKAPKVFKLTRRRLLPGRPVTVTRRHVFEHVSIRKIHPGSHRIDVQVNGRVLGGVDVEVCHGSSR